MTSCYKLTRIIQAIKSKFTPRKTRERMDWREHLALCRTVSNQSIVMYVKRVDGDTTPMTLNERLVLYVNSWYKWILKDVHISNTCQQFVCELCCKSERVSLAVHIRKSLRKGENTCCCPETACVWCVLKHAYAHRAANREPRCWRQHCQKPFSEEDLTCIVET